MNGRDIRKIRGKLTQPQFCAVIGLDNVSTLSRWERDIHSPSKVWQERLAKYKKERKI